MSTVTTYLNLVKPASPEQFSLATYNNNLDLVDTHLKDVVQKMAKGYAAYVELASNSPGINTQAVVLNIPSFTFRANRNYRIGASGNGSVDALGSAFGFLLTTCAVADAAAVTTGLTQLRGSTYRFDSTGEGRAVLDGLAKDRLVFGADTTLQIKLTAARIVGTTGSVTLLSGSTDRTCLYIEDLGAQI